MKRSLALGASSLALAFQMGLAAQAFAADDPQTAEVDEVVVTALKHSQNIQEAPASISAVDGAVLQERGVSDVEAIAQLVPNLNFGSHAGSTLITIRGIGSTVDSGITEPTVAMYVDGVFLPRSTMATLRAVDLDRVEVLRGPQGTLYGRNATGGAINFVSQAPTDSFEAQVSLSAGSRSALGISGYVSGPLGDKVSARLSAGREVQDGYVKVSPGDRRIDEVDVGYARAAIRIEPSDSLTIDLSARYEESNGANAYQQLLTPTVLPGAVQTTRPYRIFADGPFAQESKTTVLAAQVSWDINDDVTFKSITSYVDHKSRVDFDADGTTYAGFDAVGFSRPSESYGQEFNLVGSTGPIDWLAGAYFYHEEASNTLPLRLGAVFAPGFGVPAGTYVLQSVASETDSFALFGDLTWSVTDAFKVTAGLRYNNEEQSFDQLFGLNIPGVGFVPGAAAYATGPVNVGVSTEKLLPKVGVQYAFSDDINFYAQWSRGFKSGGENLEGGSGLAIGRNGLFKPEQVDAYEAGLKTQWLDGRVTANFAAFYYDYADLQVTITRPPSTTIVQNADARIYGLEGELAWDVTEAFKLNAAFSLTHARFDGFAGFDDARPLGGIQNLDGSPLPHAPDFTVSLGAEYNATLGAFWLPALTLRADAFYSDDVVLRYFGTPQDTQDAYGTLNLSAKLATDDGRTSVNLFLNNATDETYLRNITYIGAIGAYMGNYAPPRTWGVRLSQKF